MDILNQILNSIGELSSKIGKSFASNIEPIAIANTIREVDDSAVRIARSFGQGRENVLGLSQAMAGAVREVTLLGGGFDSIAEIQKEVGEGLGRNLILTTDSYEKLFAASEVTGRSAKEIVTSFKDAGFSAYQASSQMEKVVNVARSMGVNAQAVSGKVLENMDALNKFNFDGGVQGLARMAAQATSLRIDMKNTLDLAEKVFNPEGAIEVAAAMQRLGVANSELLDPLRLMDLSQNDPAELQNQLAKMSEQFVQLNKNGQFEIMPGAKRQLREISSALNIPYETLTKMAIGSKELDEKLQRIKFPPNAFTEEQEKMIANMAEMGKDGLFKIQIGRESLNLDEAIGKIEGMSEDERKAFFESQQPKTMEQLAKDQLTILDSINKNIEALGAPKYAFAGTKLGKDALTAPELLTRELERVTTGLKSFNITSLSKQFDEGGTNFLKTFNSFITGEGSLTDLVKNISDIGEDIENFSFETLKEFNTKYVESIKNLEGANNQFIDILLNASKRIKIEFMNDQNLNAQQTPTPLPPQTTNPQMNGVNNAMGQSMIYQPNQTNTQTNNSPVDINLNITAPPNIDINQLVTAFNDTGLREAMVTAINKTRTDNNLSTTNPNMQRQTIITNNANGLTGIPV